MSETTRLSLPLILAAQAQKHVTHNEALAELDVLVHLALASRTVLTPPPAPAEGDAYQLDGVAGGPGAGGWSLDLTEGVVVANSGDHILLSGNSVGTIALDGTTVKVAFRGIERVEW